MLEVRGLCKQYGDKVALDDVSFTVKRGNIVGLLGRNGAGKTTIMNIITGYLSSDSGDVNIGEYDILEQPEKAKQRIGYLPEQPPVYPEMTVYKYLRFACKLMHVPKKEIDTQLDKILKLVDIEDVKDRLIGNLSKGYKQRVGLAKALCGDPDLIILDEPTVGLDPKQIVEIRKTIKKLGETHTVILSSHILNEISDICTNIVIINKGRLVADSSLKALMSDIKADRKMLLRVSGGHDIAQELGKIPGVIKVDALGEVEPKSTDYQIEYNEDVRGSVSAAAHAGGCTILMLKMLERTLEEVFLRLTSDGEEEIAI